MDLQIARPRPVPPSLRERCESTRKPFQHTGESLCSIPSLLTLAAFGVHQTPRRNSWELQMSHGANATQRTQSESHDAGSGPLYVLFLFGPILIFLLMAAGFWNRVSTQSKLPALRISYQDEHDRMVREQEPQRILWDLTLASSVDFNNDKTAARLYDASRRVGNRESFILAMRRLLPLYPDDALLHFELANALMAAEDRETAIVHSARAVSLQPQNEAFKAFHESLLQGEQTPEPSNSPSLDSAPAGAQP